jgi:hypothetical protein
MYEVWFFDPVSGTQGMADWPGSRATADAHAAALEKHGYEAVVVELPWAA